MGILTSFFKPNDEIVKWYKVFDSEEESKANMPLNKPITVLIENQKICFVRTQKGYFAVADACPHLGASLSKGVCNNFLEVVCPWHSYRFDLVTGEENTKNEQNMKVKTYISKVEKNGIYIGLEKI